MRDKFVPIVAAIVTAVAAPASAATIISNVSGVYDESGSSRSNAPAGALKLNDFDETDGDPVLEIVGDTHIFGFVAHRANQSGSLYTDKWAMDFGSDSYNVVFTWEGFDNPRKPVEFDGRFGVNGVYTLLGVGGTLNLGVLTGKVSFDLDPIFGLFKSSSDERAVWDISAVKVSAVPLPAGLFLMATGLAGLAAARRMRKKA